jgi:hypothetical membrane protein
MQSKQRRALAACLALSGLVVPIVDMTVVAVAGAFRPDHSHIRNYVSELGDSGSSIGPMVSAWWVAWGVLLLPFAAATYLAVERRRFTWIAPTLLAVSFVSASTGGMFPCDPGGLAVTWSGRVHLLAAQVGTLAVLPVPWVFWLGARHDPTWQSYGFFSGLMQASWISAFVLLALGYYEFFGFRFIAGAIEIVFIALEYAWNEAIALRVLRMNAK